jgi:phosphohistidine phosphatase
LKTLLIIRHAKSDQSFFGKDFDRPLNERGLKDAPDMANRIVKKNILIDALVSSPAIRATETAQLFYKTIDNKNSIVVYNAALYHAPASVFVDTVKKLNNNWNTVAIFSHNPGITSFVNNLNCGVLIDNMPTCGVFSVSAAVTDWALFNDAEKTFLFFDYPKNI